MRISRVLAAVSSLVLVASSAVTQGVTPASVRAADFDGADCGAKINSADLYLGGSPGEIWVDAACGAQLVTPVTIHWAHLLRFVQGGTYTLDATISLTAGSSLLGAGQNSTDLHWELPYMNGVNVTTGSSVSELTLRGANVNTRGQANHPGVTSSGIMGGAQNNVVITHCTIKQWGEHGINSGAGSADWMITNNIIQANYGDGLLAASNSSEFVIQGNVVLDNVDNGIDVNGGYHLIVGNNVRGNGGTVFPTDDWGILIQALHADGANADHNIVMANVVAKSAEQGIIIRAETGQSASYNIVSGNTVYGSGAAAGAFNGDGINIDGTAGGDYRGNVISGNTVFENGRYGINVESGTSAHIANTVLEGNVVLNNGAGGTFAGIYLGGSQADSIFDTQITNNTVVQNTGSRQVEYGSSAAVSTTEVGSKTQQSDNAYEIASGILRIGGPANLAKRLDIYGWMNASGSGVTHSILADASVCGSNTILCIQPIGGAIAARFEGIASGAARFPNVRVDQSLSVGPGGRAIGSTSDLVIPVATLITTVNLSDVLSIPGITPNSHCFAQPSNAIAAGLFGVYVEPGLDSLRLYHPQTPGAAFNIFCSAS